MIPDHDPGARPARPVRWWTGAVPVVALVLSATGGAALASPSVRHQLDVSTHRQPDSYLALAFADEAVARSCSEAAEPGGVHVDVISHLQTSATLPWTATVTAAPQGHAKRAAKTSTVRTGSVTVAPGETGVFSVPFRAPASAYTLTVRLDGRTEHLTVHCDGGQQ